MPSSIEAAKAGVTTGEWGMALRGELGNIARRPAYAQRRDKRRRASTNCAERCSAVSIKLGKRLKFVIGKPGLDGHSNGAEQIAARATDAGMDVVYDGIRFTPEEIVERAKMGTHVVGLSIRSGSHVAMTREVLALMKQAGLAHVPVIVGGIIPPEDAEALKRDGVAAVYTPKDFAINQIMAEIVATVERGLGDALSHGHIESADPLCHRAGEGPSVPSLPRQRRQVVGEDGRVLPHPSELGVGDHDIGGLGQEGVDAVVGKLALSAFHRLLIRSDVGRSRQPLDDRVEVGIIIVVIVARPRINADVERFDVTEMVRS